VLEVVGSSTNGELIDCFEGHLITSDLALRGLVWLFEGRARFDSLEVLATLSRWLWAMMLSAVGAMGCMADDGDDTACSLRSHRQRLRERIG
jgi:hypothetical protein